MITMGKARLEAFSDAVLAIIITIMVLELKVPHGDDLSALAPLWPAFVSYLLSFIYLGIYWNNHHHLMHTVHHVSGGILWANMHLLFWLSLIPFTTGWMGENHFAAVPSALYGFDLLMAANAYLILQMAILKEHGENSPLAAALGKDWKGKISSVLYLAGVAAALLHWQFAAQAIYALVALLWIVPDRRIEKVLKTK